MYVKSEQLSLAEALTKHWDKYFPSLPQSIVPENIEFLATDETDILT